MSLHGNSYYDERYFEDRNDLDLRLASTIELFIKKRGLRTVLDVGCGTGLLASFLAEHTIQVTGCDNQKEAIQSAWRINKVKVVFGSAIELPFEDSSFDMITLISVIEHLSLEDGKAFIKEARRVLKPHGYVFIVTPNYATPIRLFQRGKWFGYSDPTHIHFYTSKSLAKMLRQYGFMGMKTAFPRAPHLPFRADFGGFFNRMPVFLVNFFVYLLFSTRLSLFRNSFWMAAQKND